MPSTPKLPNTISKPAKKWVVRLAASDAAEGALLDDTNETRLLRNPVVYFGSSGNQMDRCELEYDLSINNERIQDISIFSGFSRGVEIVEIPTEPKKPPKLIYWGELTAELKGVSNHEDVKLTATIEPYHWGSTLDGMVFRRPSGANDAVTIPGEIVFNPENEGIVEGNKSNHWFDETHEARYWVNPDSVRTAASRLYQGDQLNEWTLKQIMCAMCWHCNPDETYIKNPSAKNFDEWLKDAPEVKNLVLPKGKYLSDYLDAILNPYGYGWRLTYKFNEIPAEDEDDPPMYEREVSWVIFKLGDGLPIPIYQQKPGDTIGAKHTLSITSDWKCETDIGNQPNKITAYGGVIRREITAELFRAWLESDDSQTAAQLTRSTGANFESKQNVWRLWVFNEAGDYCSLRSVVRPIPATPTDLTSVLGANTLPRRRRALDCLTHYLDASTTGTRRQREVFCQWYDASNTWKPFPNGWGEVILVDQFGIYFAGDSPPEELIARGNDARIRITATIEGDVPLTSIVDRNSSSINPRTFNSVMDVSDKFIDQQVQTSGTYLSVLAGVPTSEERDDTTDLTTWTTAIQALEDMAAIRMPIVINGLNTQYVVGKVINKVRGREVSFNRRSDTAATSRYSQIVGVVMDHKAQTTTLTVEPLNEQPEAV